MQPQATARLMSLPIDYNVSIYKTIRIARALSLVNRGV